MFDFNKANSHPRDSRIHFDAPSHTYYIEAENGDHIYCDSVTTVVENCFEQFDAEKWARRKATPEHSAEEIMAEWARKGEEARDAGTLMHDRIERYYLGEELEDEAYDDESFCRFLRFTESYHLKPYRSEWRIYSRKYRIAGTLDFLVYDDGVFEIYDWKRSAKIVDCFGNPNLNNFGKFAFAPLQNLPDTTFHHYALQVSLYRYILETEYDIIVADGHLGTFHPAYDRPFVVNMPYLRDEVIALLNDRYEKFTK